MQSGYDVLKIGAFGHQVEWFLVQNMAPLQHLKT
jgi:hypothetical protein